MKNDGEKRWSLWVELHVVFKERADGENVALTRPVYAFS